MKKITLFAVAGMLAFTACGPSAEEIAKKEQAIKDSIAMVEMETMKQDSIAKAQEEAKMAEIEKIKQDSIAQANANASSKPTKSSAKKSAPASTNAGRTGASKEGSDNAGKIDPTKPVGRNAATKVQ